MPKSQESTLIEVPNEAEIKTTVRLNKGIAESLQELVSDRKRIIREIEISEVIMVDKLTMIITTEVDSNTKIRACQMLQEINSNRVNREQQWRTGDIDPAFEIFDVFTSKIFEKD